MLPLLFVASIFAGAVGAAAAPAAPGHHEAWIGKPAPAIELKDLDGGRVSLADYKGRLVVIHFGASW